MDPLIVIAGHVQDWWPLIAGVVGVVVYGVRLEGQVKAGKLLAEATALHTQTMFNAINKHLEKLDERQEQLIDYLLRKETWDAKRESRSPAPAGVDLRSGQPSGETA